MHIIKINCTIYMFFNFITENLLEQIITETSNRSGIFLNMCFKKIFLFEMLSSHSSYIDVNANIQNDVINYFILINIHFFHTYLPYFFFNLFSI